MQTLVWSADTALSSATTSAMSKGIAVENVKQSSKKQRLIK